MIRRLALITEIISPYRIPLFNSLARRTEVNLHVIFLSETDPSLRDWQVYKDEIQFSYEVLPSWRKRVAGRNVLLNRGLRKALRAFEPQVVVCGGYNYFASWDALMWSRSRGIPFMLWSESNAQDARSGSSLVEFSKAQFLRRCSGFVVPGLSAGGYLRTKGVPQNSIHTAVNAVDNDRFAAGSEAARARAAQIRDELGLPQRYFLFVGRLVPEKGVFELLSAYSALEPPLRDRIALVFAGDGVARHELEERAASISGGSIHFSGFVQREQLINYYALSEVLVLPTYTDTWGLVVNEAMACGLPVIVSSAAGCAADLVMHDENGLIVPARDPDLLRQAMQKIAGNGWLRESMMARSRERIANYSPERWSSGIVQMLHSLQTGE